MKIIWLTDSYVMTYNINILPFRGGRTPVSVQTWSPYHSILELWTKPKEIEEQHSMTQQYCISAGFQATKLFIFVNHFPSGSVWLFFALQITQLIRVYFKQISLLFKLDCRRWISSVKQKTIPLKPTLQKSRGFSRVSLSGIYCLYML